MTVVGTSTAVRLALFLKMFLLYPVVEAVYSMMKKVLDKFVSSVMTPVWGGKISLSMLVKRKIQMCLAASYSLAVSGSTFLLLVKKFRNLQHQEAEHQVQEGDGSAAVLKQLFFRGVYQWIFYPSLFETASSRISLILQEHMSDASRIFLFQ